MTTTGSWTNWMRAQRRPRLDCQPPTDSDRCQDNGEDTDDDGDSVEDWLTLALQAGWTQ